MAYDVLEGGGRIHRMRSGRMRAGGPDGGMARSIGLIATLIALFMLGYFIFA